MLASFPTCDAERQLLVFFVLQGPYNLEYGIKRTVEALSHTASTSPYLVICKVQDFISTFVTAIIASV